MRKCEKPFLTAVVDRIEDGRHVVLSVVGIGQIVLPARKFPFAVREGQWIDFWAAPNPKTEQRIRSEVRRLQAKLVRRGQSKK
ncbi:MAG TPA: DUF3006 family protein [Elusimicrobiota bacterium]|nr:DUF3006 family protein [Elusimicrobiota bacterium]